VACFHNSALADICVVCSCSYCYYYCSSVSQKQIGEREGYGRGNEGEGVGRGGEKDGRRREGMTQPPEPLVPTYKILPTDLWEHLTYNLLGDIIKQCTSRLLFSISFRFRYAPSHCLPAFLFVYPSASSAFFPSTTPFSFLKALVIPQIFLLSFLFPASC